MTRSAVEEPVRREPPPVVSVGRPPWWLVAVSLVVGTLVTVDLLGRGVVERIDLRVSEHVSSWGLRGSAAYWPLWAVTQLGGRAFILAVLLALVGYLAVRRRTLLPLARLVLALALLTAVIYAFKYGAGRTAPSYPGSFFHRDGASFPSGHVANAVLMWGVARWQAVDYRLPTAAQRLFRVLSLVAPLVTAVTMIALDFHWTTDALVGGAVGIVLLGVVHLLDATVLSRWVRARAGRPTA